MTKTIDSAMLLAAGLGTRLRPLTLKTPKPLLPLNGCLLIDHQLCYLAKSGIRRVAINLHHLGSMIREHVGDGKKFGLEIFYSEENHLLDTGGGIKKAAPFFEGCPFVALNSDALINAKISELISNHLKSNTAATMVVKELCKNDSYTPVKVSQTGTITDFGTGSHFYTGLQIISAEILDILPPAGKPSCLIKDGFQKFLALGGNINAYLYKGYFNDLGTAERYEQAQQDIAHGVLKLFPE